MQSQIKNLIYTVNSRLPTEKAHGVQIVNTASELAQICKKNDINFELIICNRDNLIKENIFEYYKISSDKQFKITKLKTISLFKPFYFSFWLQRIHFALKLQWYLFWRYYGNCTVYSRDWFLLFTLMFKVKRMYWETHEGQNNFLISILMKKLDGLVGITKGLTDFYSEKYPKFGLENMLVAHDAVNKDRFDSVSISKEQARSQLNLPADKKIVTYVGSVGMYNWKGVDTFVEAAKFAPEIVFLVVGGKPEEVENLKQKVSENNHPVRPAASDSLLEKEGMSAFENIIFAGHQKQEMTPIFRRASDVLVIPNKKGDIVSERFTSPIKLFSNMASNVPIVASDLPSLREVLNENNATFFEPNNPESLAESIKSVFLDYLSAENKAKKSYNDVDEYTYTARAKKIFDFVVKLSI